MLSCGEVGLQMLRSVVAPVPHPTLPLNLVNILTALPQRVILTLPS